MVTRPTAMAPDASTSPVGQWQPIETAPKNGTQFLALVSNGWYALVRAPALGIKEGWPFLWWQTSSHQSFPVVETHPADTDWSEHHTLLLTHWMPLPPAPEVSNVG